MTYRERERETIRRLREELEKRQSEDRTGLVGHAGPLPEGVRPDEKAEVLFELVCL